MTQLSDAKPVSATDALLARYRISSGPVLLTGVQAIARLLVEQHERDRRRGRRVATFVSGYQGSPLGGLDRMLARIPELSSEHDMRFVPGVNEELAATSVWGSQVELPRGERTHDGVVGVWYGKGPGLDRASDALRHATMYGAHPAAGCCPRRRRPGRQVLHRARRERAIAGCTGMPVLFPRNAEEIVAFGLTASRCRARRDVGSR